MLTLQTRAIVKGLEKEGKSSEALAYIASKHSVEVPEDETPIVINQKKIAVQESR